MNIDKIDYKIKYLKYKKKYLLLKQQEGGFNWFGLFDETKDDEIKDNETKDDEKILKESKQSKLTELKNKVSEQYNNARQQKILEISNRYKKALQQKLLSVTAQYNKEISPYIVT